MTRDPVDPASLALRVVAAAAAQILFASYDFRTADVSFAAGSSLIPHACALLDLEVGSPIPPLSTWHPPLLVTNLHGGPCCLLLTWLQFPLLSTWQSPLLVTLEIMKQLAILESCCIEHMCVLQI